MSELRDFWKSLVGKKQVMAVTGVILTLFIIGHLVGNLLVFAGPGPYNDYSHFLKHGIIEILWIVRLVLLVSLVLHVVASIQVSLASRRARPIGYAVKKNIETTYAARTMIWSGPLLFVYVVYHLMMFTFLTTGPGYSPTDVYRNVVLSFRDPAISAVYAGDADFSASTSNAITQAVNQGEQLGVSISKVLQVQSEQLRIERRQRAEEQAAQAPIKMLFPLVGCIFPSLFVVILGPALILIMQNLAV